MQLTCIEEYVVFSCLVTLFFVKSYDLVVCFSGKDCNLLIHEGTMADDLADEAKKKDHRYVHSYLRGGYVIAGVCPSVGLLVCYFVCEQHNSKTS